jgi:hypothetical protein
MSLEPRRRLARMVGVAGVGAAVLAGCGHAHGGAVRICAAIGLRTEATIPPNLVFQSAAPGAVGVVRLVNISGRSCLIKGWPRVRLARPGLTVDRQRFRRVAYRPGAAPQAIRLGPRQRVQTTVSFSNWCGHGSNAGDTRAGVAPSRMLIDLPNGGGRLWLDFRPVAPECGNSAAPADVTATAFIRSTASARK